MSVHANLLDRLRSGDAVIGVIGLGYVGLPLLSAMHAAGYRVIGFDVDPQKPERLRRGETYLKHLGEAMTRELAASSRFDATTDHSRLDECDAVIVCVPTPLTHDHQPDLSYVIETGAAIGRCLRAGQLIVLESTTYPGTTRHEFLGAILGASAQAARLKAGEDFFVAYSPEREDPGNAYHSTRTIPKVVGGIDPRSCELAVMMYARAVKEVIAVESAEIAESAKLLENIFRAVNIALVNEMKVVLDAMGIDVWQVIRAASSKPFGFMPFYPGPGLGGHCIPIDPFYMSWKARQVGCPTQFIELAGRVNLAMPAYVIDRLRGALERRGVSLRGARVLILGLAYKPDIDDVRESPSFELIRLLRTHGAHPDYTDPYVPATWPGRKGDLGLRSVELSAASVAEYDAVVISTNHSSFDYELLAQHARLVVDTRDAMRDHAAFMGDRLVRA